MENPHPSSNMGSKASQANRKVSAALALLMSLFSYMRRFFRRLNVSNPVERNNFFVQTNDVLFQQEPFADWLPQLPKIEDIHIRHERQTLRRLPRSGAIIFMVRTFMTPLLDLEKEKDSLKTFLEDVRVRLTRPSILPTVC